MANSKGGRPLKFKTEAELQKKIEEYFKSCWTQKLDMWGNPIFLKDEKGNKTKEAVMVQNKPYTVGGLAAFLDVDADTLLNYQARTRFFGTVKRAKRIIYAYAEESLYSGKNPTGAIFNLKNNWGWKDKSETDITTDGLPIQVVSYEDIKKK